MNSEDFVSYEIAKKLKAQGFDYPCYFYYTKQDAPDEHVWHTTSEEAPIDYNRSIYAGCSMPTLAQAQKWLRDVKNIIILINYDDYVGWTFFSPHRDIDNNNPYCESYESALSAGIEAALKLIEEGER